MIIKVNCTKEEHLEIFIKAKKLGFRSMGAYLLTCEEFFVANAPKITVHHRDEIKDSNPEAYKFMGGKPDKPKKK